VDGYSGEFDTRGVAETEVGGGTSWHWQVGGGGGTCDDFEVWCWIAYMPTYARHQAQRLHLDALL